jgi:hypothetical protein
MTLIVYAFTFGSIMSRAINGSAPLVPTLIAAAVKGKVKRRDQRHPALVLELHLRSGTTQ